MYGILLVVHVIVAVCLIGLILIQQGKGAQTGAAFGSGASTTIFGSQGTTGFLSRSTAIFATLFFIINLILAYVVNSSIKKASIQPMPVAPVSAPVTEVPDQNEANEVPDVN
jgi:preprotein translocase subunit SecG